MALYLQHCYNLKKKKKLLKEGSACVPVNGEHFYWVYNKASKTINTIIINQANINNKLQININFK